MHYLSPRQIHLDFHTSEAIDNIGADFLPEVFANTMKEASVTSATVFARGHHGWLYYDSKAFPERVHPNLANRNLLVEQVRALHSVGINAPVYITVQWDYYSAVNHPEWLVRKKDGSHEGTNFTDAGFYQALCVNTPFADFVKAQTLEVMDLLGDELDGFFFDIVAVRPCWCSTCRKQMRQRGIDMLDDEAVHAFAKENLDRFMTEMSELVRSKKANCPIFYNTHTGPIIKNVKDAFSHFEVESLPTGGWGYMHFPVSARYVRTLGKDCMGMTGKFHRSWGDFHSIRPQAALEYDAFRMLSFGFACSVGDQLEPCGVLNPAAYRLIGNVFKMYAQREEYARPSKAIVEAAVVIADSTLSKDEIPDAPLGAVQMLEELAVQFDIIDADTPLDNYRLIILPEDITVTEELEKRLLAFTANGGKVLAFDKGGLKEDGTLSALFGAEYLGREPLYPNFIQGNVPLCNGLESDQVYVIYRQGAKIKPTDGVQVLSAELPYFAKSGKHFCSHEYPPSAHDETVPCAVQTDSSIYFAHPMMGQYYDDAPRWVKLMVKNAIDTLLGTTIIQHDGPSTVRISLLDQPHENRQTLHVLHYIPVRKSATIDIVEERTPLHDLTVTVNLPKKYTRATLVPENLELSVSENTITIPKVDGYAIVTLEE